MCFFSESNDYTDFIRKLMIATSALVGVRVLTYRDVTNK